VKDRIDWVAVGAWIGILVAGLIIWTVVVLSVVTLAKAIAA
jgi:uncharacterized membrane protein